jgi:ubiquinone/menaquinone biosynthesis C-methylase UbiE
MAKKKSHINTVGKGFDRITFIYDTLAAVMSFNQINKSQLAFLSQLKTQSTCLILGGGTGLFLQRLLEENKSIQVTYVDASAEMIRCAKKRIVAASDHVARVTFINEPVENFSFETYDVIVCNYFLDLFEQDYVETLIGKFKESLVPNGMLYVTDFNFPNTKYTSGWLMNIGLKALYVFFKWTTSLETKSIVHFDALILKGSFEIIHSKNFLYEILSCKTYKLQ